MININRMMMNVMIIINRKITEKLNKKNNKK